MIGLARTSLQYRPSPKDDDVQRLAIIRLAKQYGRYGYRKVTELLRVEGWKVNQRKVERLWREEGLQLPQRHKKRRRLYHKDSSIIRMRPTHPNYVWAVDFPLFGSVRSMMRTGGHLFSQFQPTTARIAQGDHQRARHSAC
ncbi:IS3 family transposase [uncultured Tateyamaria sp.]|uniref:IS3 family transposase n=1 Tax=uncultured Tateyamaria sp. TaxID=455651 RepID=UPI00344E9DB7